MASDCGTDATAELAYVGLRGQQPAFGHGGPLVVGVIARERRRALLVPARLRSSGADYEWGYEGAGPHLLATAILFDRLGRDVGYGPTRKFMCDVVARLPHEFELRAADVDAWLERNRPRA